MKANRIALIISMLIMSVCCFAQTAADKLFLEGQNLQKVMTIESQNKAINKFKSAKTIYKTKERKDMCDNQVEVCNRNIKTISSAPKPQPNPKPQPTPKAQPKAKTDPAPKTQPLPKPKPAQTAKSEDKPASTISKPSAKSDKNQVTNMPYNGGVYTGAIKNGKPHGKGILVFGTKTIISAYDINKTMAEAGESIEGKFENGVFSFGTYHSVSGDKKLNFGSLGE